jgi:phosphate transport system protein
VNDQLHTDREFETELRLLRGRLVTMASKVEQMVAGSVRALVERDSDLARQMIAHDREINRLELQIDEMCIRLLALRQPAASDLRFVATALKIVTDLERMGDLAGNIADRTLELNDVDERMPAVDVQKMGDTVQRQIRDSIDAFVERDIQRAEQIRTRDAEIDELYWKYYRELMSALEEPAPHVQRAIKLLFVVKHLERIADHATNIAEMVIFMVRGKDIRHPGSREP